MSYISLDNQGIPNKKLYAKLAQLFKNGLFAPRKISVEKAEQLQEMGITEDAIVDLEFLQFFPGLKELSVASANLSDIAGLRFVPNLKELSLCNHVLTDISALRYCPHLEFLEIETYMGGKSAQPSAIKNFSVVGNLHNLVEISLEDNTIENISWITSLKNLEHAALSNNPITDLSPLSELPKLRTVEVDSEQDTPVDH